MLRYVIHSRTFFQMSMNASQTHHACMAHKNIIVHAVRINDDMMLVHVCASAV
jgi:acetolactate synthase regulatory subunit